MLISSLGATILRKHLDDVPLWRGDHVEVRQLVQDFGQFLYLPRLAGPDVLTRAIQDGVGLLTWKLDSFAYAESYDDEDNRYLGLRGSKSRSPLRPKVSALVVKPDVASEQIESRDRLQKPEEETPGQPERSSSWRCRPGARHPPEPTKPKARRYHGAVTLNAQRVGRDASQIADEVIAHLSGIVGSEVSVTLEIHAEIPDGAPENVVRTVTENSQTLKFESHGFEES